MLPVRDGLLIIDATTFLKQGRHSVGVARQYSGLQRQIVNCQAAVTAALWSGGRAYFVGAALYLPKEWLNATAQTEAHIPQAVRFQQKWRLALTLLRQVRASGIQLRGVLADAEFGDKRVFRNALHRLRLPYAVRVSTHLTAFLGIPALTRPRTAPGPHQRHLATGTVAHPIADLITMARPRWRRVTWRNRRGAREYTVECTAIRVTPAIDFRHPRLSPDVWLLAERDVRPRATARFYYVNLPSTTPLADLVRFAHQRWAIEMQYQELKTDLGLDHFEGRTYPGWQHHVVLTALTYNFLQLERRRTRAPLTFPMVRAVVQEIFTAYLFAQRPHYLKRIEALRSVQLRI